MTLHKTKTKKGPAQQAPYPSAIDSVLDPDIHNDVAPGTAPAPNRLPRPTHRIDEAATHADTQVADVPGIHIATKDAIGYHAALDHHHPKATVVGDHGQAKPDRDVPLVVKFGGSALAPDTVERFAARVAGLVGSGRRVAIVHGGGKAIDDMLSRLNVERRFVDGLRYTDDSALETVELVLSGTVNKAIVRALRRAGTIACGVSGTDGGLFTAHRRRHDHVAADGSQKLVDLGRVGDIDIVDTTVINALWESKNVPVVSPLALDDEHDALNVNADSAAAALAAALGAELILVTDVPGVLDGPSGNIIDHLDADAVRRMIQQGSIKGGMIPKTDACLAALAGGSPKARILDVPGFVEQTEDDAAPGTSIVAG